MNSRNDDIEVVNNEVAEFADQIGIFKVEIINAHCRELRHFCEYV